MINLTPIARIALKKRVKAVKRWSTDTEDVQLQQMMYIVRRMRRTRWGRDHLYNSIHDYDTFLRQIQITTYEDYRNYVMRMINGEADVLWPGVVKRFAQSSGTTGGKSKYIPVTDESLQMNHYAGTRDVVAHYLSMYPKSRLFAGKALILGGSYANELELPPDVYVGDLSASLIDCINPRIEKFRVPSKDIALMEDWSKKLPALVEAAAKEDITNLSGVPSWFLTVLKGVLSHTGAKTINDVWPNLEVFFHGGISFAPYRHEYNAIIDPERMRYIETYNASEGFFATQDRPKDPSMLLLMDVGVFYEFLPLSEMGKTFPQAVPAWAVKPGEIYALLITACNGLCRYMIGDTVRIESINPIRISIAGRISSYINVFGEEVMEHNATEALTKACDRLGCSATDFTVGPVFATTTSKGCHEWWIEWGTAPNDINRFAVVLDECLQQLNSDYQAKRKGDIFLGVPIVRSAPAGLFEQWLATTGKLGGQRKIPRLSNDRHIVNQLNHLEKTINHKL